MSFRNILATEILKTKNAHILIVAILFPFIITGFACIANIHLFGHMAEIEMNPWISLCSFTFDCYKFLYPILTVIICFKLHESGESAILLVPQIYSYCRKAAVLVFCLFISLLIGLSLIFLSGKFCSVLYPLMKFQGYTLKEPIIIFFVKLFFFNLSIVAIQLFISTCFNTVIKAIGIPLVLIIIGAIMSHWEYIELFPTSYLFPYSYSFQAALDFENGDGFVMDKMFYWSILHSVFFFALGAFVIRLQRMHSK